MKLKVLAIESYYGGSHAQWLNGLKKFSQHDIAIASLPPNNWKWRMHGGAISLATQVKKLGIKPDIVLATSLIDLPLFKSISGIDAPVLLYFHENQFAYPQSPKDRDREKERDSHYGFINFSSALLADKVCFNSQFNRQSFLDGSKELLEKMPDHNLYEHLEAIKSKSAVIPLGFDFPPNNVKKEKRNCPLLLWNHRWEWDKDPKEFYRLLVELKSRSFNFELALLGQSSRSGEYIRQNICNEFKDQIVIEGHLPRSEYLYWLAQSDLLPVTSHQDFFGISIVEAMHHGVQPLLPKRLSYPEIIPKSWHETVFYSSLENLVEKIINRDFPPTDFLKNHTQQWRWKNVIKTIDQAFLDICQHN